MKRTAIAACVLICGIAAGTAVARDVGQIPPNTDAKTMAWFRSAMSPNGEMCCDEADGYREGAVLKLPHGEVAVIFRSWRSANDGYHLSVMDPADLSVNELIWNGPVVTQNPTGTAVVWLARRNGVLIVRCFSPGSQG